MCAPERWSTETRLLLEEGWGFSFEFPAKTPLPTPSQRLRLKHEAFFYSRFVVVPSTFAEDVKNQVKRGTFANVAIKQRLALVFDLLSGENETLVVDGNPSLALNFGFDAFDRVRWAHSQAHFGRERLLHCGRLCSGNSQKEEHPVVGINFFYRIDRKFSNLFRVTN